MKLICGFNFVEQLFITKVFCEAFMFLLIVFVIFCQKEIGKKAASKMLEKLTHAHVEKVII